MRRVALAFGVSVPLFWLVACDRADADGPPRVHLGDSLCEQCNMIVSDERWATATVVAGPRGPEPRLFDDFNCQVHYELAHPEAEVLARWSHDCATGAWLRTERATFLMSAGLRTPMGSRVAAYADAASAEAAAAELGGDVMGFEVLWGRLRSVDERDLLPHGEAPQVGKESHDGP